MGTDDSRVDEVISIIEQHSRKRTQMVPSSTYGTSTYASFPMEVTVEAPRCLSPISSAMKSCNRILGKDRGLHAL